MLYSLAIILPPVAVLACGKPFQAILNFLLSLCFWFPGAVHALFIANTHLADKRANNLLRAVERLTEAGKP